MDTTGYITVEEAARRLGRSGQTIRRWRDKDILRGVMVVTSKGKALLIDPKSLPNVASRQQSATLIDNASATVTSIATTNESAESPVVDLIRELHAEVGQLREEKGQLLGELSRLQAVVDSLQKKPRWRWPWSR